VGAGSHRRPLTLGTGYGIAIAVKSPLSALGLFFVAVVLVIIGTYCLFTAVSIVILKQLRKNKSYYYRTKHFIPVSGMLHRMRRNAAGLASICILCTMVLVMVSGTLCLYLGAEDVLKDRYPHDITVTYRAPGERVAEDAIMAIQSRASEKGIAIRSLTTLEYLSFSVRIDGSKMTGDTAYTVDGSDIAFTCFITDGEYERLTGKAVSLGGGEVLTQGSQKEAPDAFELLGKRFTVKEHISDFPSLGENASLVSNTICFVVSESDLQEILALRKASYDEDAGAVTVDINVDLDGSDAEKLAFLTGWRRNSRKP
jgi:putative ABC transport system permease protein